MAYRPLRHHREATGAIGMGQFIVAILILAVLAGLGFGISVVALFFPSSRGWAIHGAIWSLVIVALCFAGIQVMIAYGLRHMS
jgi:hypothetical protein